MTPEEYRAAFDDLIWLAACAVNGEVPDRARAAAVKLEHLYAAAQQHQLTAAAGMALRSAGLGNDAFDQETAKAQRKNALLDADRAALFARLDEEGIWHTALKGAVLKDLYPRFGMRQMADYDILIDADRAGDARAVMESLGFTAERFGRNNDDAYYKPPVSNFELHTALFDPRREPRAAAYYRDVKGRLVKDEGNACGWHFTPEDFYIYLVAHEHKHFAHNGTGLRSFLDVYVFWKARGGTLDLPYIAAETEKLGIADFERRSRSLALHLFGGEALTEEDQALLEDVAGSGTYGSVRQRVKNGVSDMGGGARGRLRYFCSRVFLPPERIRTTHPLVYRHRVLLPFFYAGRLLHAILFRSGRVKKELRALRRTK